MACFQDIFLSSAGLPEIPQRIIKESRKLGEDAGKKVGKKAGLEIAMKLTKLLIEDGRVEDLKKVTENKKYQTRLLKEYQLI